MCARCVPVRGAGCWAVPLLRGAGDRAEVTLRGFRQHGVGGCVAGIGPCPRRSQPLPLSPAQGTEAGLGRSGSRPLPPLSSGLRGTAPRPPAKSPVARPSRVGSLSSPHGRLFFVSPCWEDRALYLLSRVERTSPTVGVPVNICDSIFLLCFFFFFFIRGWVKGRVILCFLGGVGRDGCYFIFSVDQKKQKPNLR